MRTTLPGDWETECRCGNAEDHVFCLRWLDWLYRRVTRGSHAAR